MSKRIFALTIACVLAGCSTDTVTPIELGTECEPNGASQCNGNAIETCINGYWKHVTDCALSCENATCTEKTCTESELRCSADGTSVEVCTEGAWKVESECPNGCANKACVDSIDEKCEESDQNRCSEDGTGVLKCNDGTWELAETCEHGCLNRECAPECEESKTSCTEDNTNVATCSEGRWTPNEIPCEYGCKDGLCLDCEDGSFMCADDGNTLQVCESGKWVKSKECPAGCSNAACLNCKEDEIRCNEQLTAIEICKDNQWTTANECSDQTVCTTINEIAECKSACLGQKKGENDAVCTKSEENSAAAVDTCEADDNGTLYSTNRTTTMCPDDCYNGLCIECEDGTIQCDENKIMVCENNQWKLSEVCPFTCNEGKCENPYQKECEDSCDDTCDRGVCITPEVTAIAIGAACDQKKFTEYCLEDTAVFCDNTGHVGTENCTGKGGCTIVPNGSQKLAFCRGNADKCEKHQQKQFFCTQGLSTEGSVFYESYEECYLNTDNTFTAISAASNHHIGNILADETLHVLPSNIWKCDEAGCDDKKEHCVNSEIYYCETHETEQSCRNGSPQTASCEDGALMDEMRLKLQLMGCAMMSGGPVQICAIIDQKAQCVNECHGDKEGDNAPYCDTSLKLGGYPDLLVDNCVKDDDGNLYAKSVKATSCPHGCQDGQCLSLSEDEGKPCEEGYTKCVDNDILETCVNKTISAQRCSGTASLQRPYHCEVGDDNVASCQENIAVIPEN